MVVIKRNSEILIAGDYNINLLNLDVRQAFSDFFYSSFNASQQSIPQNHFTH